MKSTIMGATVFLITCGFYMTGLMPSLGAGDSGELITAGYTLGIAHSPGYPLFVLGGRLFSGLLPWANPGYQMNMFSLVCAAATVALLGLIFLHIVNNMFAAVTMILFSLSMPGMWKSATQTEVFALNALIAVVILWLMIVKEKPYVDRRVDRLVCFLAGISLGNQHT
ncbi:MAG: DUF2723 domain-containing protein, partial [Elusimicrobia bacterium]|nr:DUF2723 domain-containing protein [Elusimicrobiota bacterium]MBD3411522.1 DUF2723 domain-containing protein [Elusimicrobiota bacterium]